MTSPRSGTIRASLPCNRLLLGITGEADAGGEIAERRHRVRFGPRYQEHGSVTLFAHEGVDEQLESERERERLVRLLAAERDELLLLRETRNDVSPGHGAHRDVNDDRIAAAAGDP